MLLFLGRVLAIAEDVWAVDPGLSWLPHFGEYALKNEVELLIVC